MLKVGLTGGIATGKTTVAAIFQELGCHVIYADKIAHRLIEPGAAAYEAVVREFGREILRPDGGVDRAKLGSIVFADPRRLMRLNDIVHPLVLEAQDREVADLERAEPHAIAMIEAALLIEAGYAKRLDLLIVTWCTPQQQMERLMQKDSGRGFTLEQATQRIAAQMPLVQKRRLADEEIDCSGSMEETRQQTRALFDKLKEIEAARSR